MNTLIFLFLAGCSHDGTLCEPSGAPVAFDSVAACEAALPQALASVRDWPIASASCEAGLSVADATPDWLLPRLARG